MLKNSLKHVRTFQIELEFGSVAFGGEGKTGVRGEKFLGVLERTNNKHVMHCSVTNRTASSTCLLLSELSFQ